MTPEAHPANLLPYLDPAILAPYQAAPGDELRSGKFASPESSAALVANMFGPFFAAPGDLPQLPGLDCAWPPKTLRPEVEVRFPWAGGRHPWLDLLIETDDALIGVESKRYEPFRRSAPPAFSDAYWRPVWGPRMEGFQGLRDELHAGEAQFEHLDAAQLIKHALGLRTRADRLGRRPVLVYLYAEPDAWPQGNSILDADITRHRREVSAFADRVRGDEVGFLAMRYGELFDAWRAAGNAPLVEHLVALERHFALVGDDCHPFRRTAALTDLTEGALTEPCSLPPEAQ